MSGSPKRLARLTVAVVFVVPTVLAGAQHHPLGRRAHQGRGRCRQGQAPGRRATSSRSRSSSTTRRGSACSGVQDKLADALDDKQAAEADRGRRPWANSKTEPSRRTPEPARRWTCCSGADDLSEFSDRLEFMGALAQNDADLATKPPRTPSSRPSGRPQQYAETIEEKKAELDQMAAKRADIQAMLAGAAGAVRAAQPATTRTTSSARGRRGGCRGGRADGRRRHRRTAPVAARRHHDRRLDGCRPAARCQRRRHRDRGREVACSAPLRVGHRRPRRRLRLLGPDELGVRAGRRVPAALLGRRRPRRVPWSPSLAQAQPGDLLFFYSPISHVALYIGGGMMIHARHPGPGGQVQIGSVAGYGTPGHAVVRPS